ncbi:MAG: helix-turn-helix domain-containing protein [Nitrososphaera sp.]|nr:helix-turn-helix domain-containing protein [Nitrososphaera sp.]
MSDAMTIPDVLTLEEVADYLRLSKETIERQAIQGQIPGRRIEETWRFLKAAIDDWLRSHDSRTILLQQAGALAADEAEWLQAAARNPAFDSLNDPAEDIYSLADGEPFRDEV